MVIILKRAVATEKRDKHERKNTGRITKQSEREALSSQEETSEIPVRPRQRFRPFIVISTIILIGLLIAGGVFTSNRLTATGALLGPTPTPTLTPGSNHFYFEVAPSWSTLAVDGRLLQPIPTPNSGLLPLTLSPGVHQVTWKADPFPTVHCLLSLPFCYSQQNCTSDYTIQSFSVPHSQNVMASLISFSASLNDLSADQFTDYKSGADAAESFTGNRGSATGRAFLSFTDK